MFTAYDLNLFDLLVNEGFASIDLPDQSDYRSRFSHILVSVFLNLSSPLFCDLMNKWRENRG